MYPDFETHFDSDGEPKGNSYFEKNCNQIFSKGPAKTKEILEKLNDEIVPKSTHIFGRELKTRKLLLVSGLSLLFFLSFLGSLLVWFTNTLDNMAISQMILANNTESIKKWENPTCNLVYKVYIFNYTNVDDYEDGIAKKLNLEQLGPYAYEETLERIELSFPTDETISFREKRTLKFRPDLSKGVPEDIVVVPNIAVLTGSAMTKPLNYFTQLGFNAILTGMGEGPFVTLSAGDYLLGYHDQIYDIAKNFMPAEYPQLIGIMMPKQGVSAHNVTINTGKTDINKLAVAEKFNGQSEFDYFYGKECNSIAGTDGAINPPKAVQNKQPIYCLFPEICRRMPLIFDKETTIRDGLIAAYQYKLPEDIFDTAEENAQNDCYCDRDQTTCNMKGIFNITACKYGIPMFVSHPHFRRADPRLLEPFTGLNPNNNYTSYFKVHPLMGFTMEVRNIIQINIQVQKPKSVNKIAFLDDNMILPMVLMEGFLDGQTLPEDVLDVIYLTSFTYPTVKLGLKYGLLLTAIITLVSLVLVLRKKSLSTKNVRSGPFLKPEKEYCIG